MVPTFEKFLYPFLLSLKDGELTIKEMREKITAYFNLSEEDLQVRTTAQQVIDAWNTMHAGIADRTWEQLEHLRDQGYRLYLMSNTDDIHGQHTRSLYSDKIDAVFDEVFLSFKEELAKPDEEFFKTVDQRIADAHQTLFVDDMEVNRLAAQASVGWKTYESIDEMSVHFDKSD